MTAGHASLQAPAIEVAGLTVAYPGGAIALDTIDLTLRGPGICGLLGMNGSGKSTLFKAIMGFVRPARGTVQVWGGVVRAAQRAGIVAYVPQAEEVDWTFPISVRDVVTMGRQGRMNWLRRPSAEDRRIVSESLERVGMGAFAERQIGELSGGQRKRVFLARALAQEARVILLDEPFTGVDRRTEEAMLDILKDLKRSGHFMLVSTHDLARVPDFCDHVVLLNRRLVAAGPVAEAFTAENLSLAFGEARPRAILSAPPGPPLRSNLDGDGVRPVVSLG